MEKEKKIKQKEDIKELILNAAKETFVKDGYQGTSIRKIASKIGYSPTTIYLYYKDKNDIIYHLHQEGFNLLKMMFTALINIDSPFERLKALGRTYIQFAKENPEYYELMFVTKEPMVFLDEFNEKIWEEGSRVFDSIRQTITECQEEGYFIQGKPEHITLQAWSIVHGICSLYLSTRLQKIGQVNMKVEDAEYLLDSTFKNYVDFVEQTKRKK